MTGSEFWLGRPTKGDTLAAVWKGYGGAWKIVVVEVKRVTPTGKVVVTCGDLKEERFTPIATGTSARYVHKSGSLPSGAHLVSLVHKRWAKLLVEDQERRKRERNASETRRKALESIEIDSRRVAIVLEHIIGDLEAAKTYLANAHQNIEREIHHQRKSIKSSGVPYPSLSNGFTEMNVYAERCRVLQDIKMQLFIHLRGEEIEQIITAKEGES